LGGDPVSQDLRRIITRHLDRRFDIAPPVPSEFDPPPGSPIGSGRIGSTTFGHTGATYGLGTPDLRCGCGGH
ncbi:MAG: hypothetical protein AB8G96_16560, partial [Phycisphaerales bacterium]